MKTKLLCTIFIIVSAVASFKSGEFYNSLVMKKEAINNSLAHYNTRTGDWEWGVPIESIELDAVLPREIFLDQQKKRSSKK
jgi:hypothetical protein